ncbi:MAG TPA: CBS domain-containing protein [Ktedonobacterales bacterium]|nr:CBS domain-containing protein [Ktedonobacterales bacterium]
MIARDIMTHKVCTTSPDECIRDAARILAERHISGMPVLDKTGAIIGMFTEADIISKQGEYVKDIMSTEITTVQDDTPVDEIARILNQRKIKRVPVLARGCLVGVVSRADIVAAVAEGHLVIRQW